MPAFFCGIFGHKPTAGMIDLKGLSRKTGEETARSMVVAGPMSKHAEDLMPVMKVLMTGSNVKLDLTSKVKYNIFLLNYFT
jgi:fatty acid amide hydrolase 2